MKLEEAVATARSGDSNEHEILYEKTAAPSGAAGDPVIITAIVAGAALKGFVAFLWARTRTDVFEEEILIEHPDGRRVTHRVKFKIGKDEPVDQQIIKQLSSVSDLPLQYLENQLAT